MPHESLESGESVQRAILDWNALIGFVLETRGEREKIGPAWLLFCDIAQHLDEEGFYTTTYSKLAKKYGVAVITVKKWREHLHQHSVLESYRNGRLIAFRLLDPYRKFLKRANPVEPKESREEIQDLLALRKLLLKTVKSGRLQTPA